METTLLNLTSELSRMERYRSLADYFGNPIFFGLAGGILAKLVLEQVNGNFYENSGVSSKLKNQKQLMESLYAVGAAGVSALLAHSIF